MESNVAFVIKFIFLFFSLFNYIFVHIMWFSLLAEKRKELGDAAAKLRNGLDKIDETRAKVYY